MRLPLLHFLYWVPQLLMCAVVENLNNESGMVLYWEQLKTDFGIQLKLHFSPLHTASWSYDWQINSTKNRYRQQGWKHKQEFDKKSSYCPMKLFLPETCNNSITSFFHKTNCHFLQECINWNKKLPWEWFIMQCSIWFRTIDKLMIHCCHQSVAFVLFLFMFFFISCETAVWKSLELRMPFSIIHNINNIGAANSTSNGSIGIACHLRYFHISQSPFNIQAATDCPIEEQSFLIQRQMRNFM